LDESEEVGVGPPLAGGPWPDSGPWPCLEAPEEGFTEYAGEVTDDET
jgi:hypothetical protein